MGSLVTVHVYDVTNSSSETANSIIQGVNRMFKDNLALGGVFHCGIEVNMEEWSFGYCEHGTGVYSCKPKCNSMYSFRESIPVGVTSISPYRIRQLIATLQLEWPGTSYDLLARNCNHFSETFSEALGCGPFPTWVNSFPTFADNVVDLTHTATTPVRILGQSIGDGYNSVTTWFSDMFAATPKQAEEKVEEQGAQGSGALTVTN